MAGIYLHIPFCRQACHYCDFHFSTSLKNKEPLLNALHREIEMRANYLGSSAIETIYLGGGTPSLLNDTELNRLFDTINQHFEITSDVEITLEANPDDLTEDKMRALRNTPINRLSIGLQSFDDDDLQLMNRAHNAHEALSCVQRSQDHGFENLTIDLIYGMPNSNVESWEQNLRRALDMKVPHLSAYALTVEDGTALAHQVAKGLVVPASEETVASQFYRLVELTAAAGMDHYEISNFGLPHHYSRHNTSYWKGVPYLGIGPSAHSYDGSRRGWNVPNNARYIKEISTGKAPFEIEEVNPDSAYNEHILIGLRTAWGVKIAEIAQQHGERYAQHFQAESHAFLSRGQLAENNGTFTLTQDGKLFADHIASSLFMVE